jgi:hypothetical protein
VLILHQAHHGRGERAQRAAAGKGMGAGAGGGLRAPMAQRTNAPAAWVLAVDGISVPSPIAIRLSAIAATDNARLAPELPWIAGQGAKVSGYSKRLIRQTTTQSRPCCELWGI